MENKYLLSVVIPVYNMVKYLERCVDSVLVAQIPDMQILLIDDGSKDESPAICDRYAAAHPNVTVIHQENSGISVTRNTGIAAAQGEYIFFLDSDDRVHSEIFRKFVAFMQEKNYRPDMIFCNAEFVHVVTDRHIPMILDLDPAKMDNVTGEQAALEILKAMPDFEWHCWRYFYRRAYLLDAGHRFLEGYCYEDVKWSSQVLVQAGNVGYIPDVSVLYTFGRPDSIVNSVSLRKSTDKLVICQDCCDFAKNQIRDPQLKALMLANNGELYISAFRNYCYGLKELYPRLKEYAHLLQYSQSRFGKLLQKLTKLFGFRIGSGLTKIAFKIIDARR